MIHSFQFDLEKIFNLNFKLWESFEVNIEIKPSSDSHCGFEALSMIKCCLPLTESNVFFKKFHCRNEMFAISLRKSWQDFLHRNNFESPVSCPSFHSCNIQSSNSNAIFYSIPNIIQDCTWNVSRFPNCSIVLSDFWDATCLQFWHVRYHIFWFL